MNPAQLLDPKGFAKQNSQRRMPNYGPRQSVNPTPSEPSGSNLTSGVPKFDPKALLNPRAVNGAPSADPHRNQDGHLPAAVADEPEAHSPGLGHMIERFHNVKNREFAPSLRKHKPEANEDDGDRERKRSKATFKGAVTGGPLTEHMKAEREKHAAEGWPTSEPIVIEDDGDNDVVFVKENAKERQAQENEEICLGVVQGKALMSRIPAVSQRAQGAFGQAAWPPVKLELRRLAMNDNRVELVDRSGTACGMLDLKLAGALVRLLDGRQVNHMRFCPWLMSRKRSMGEYPGQHVSQSADLSVLLYAPRGRADMVGRYLSQQQLFLRDPRNVGIPNGTEVYNPHNIRTMYGGASGSSQRTPQISQPVMAVQRTVEEMRRDASNMFDSLVQRENLPQMEPTSQIITTPLLAHQKQALRFLTEHEQADDARGGGGQPFSLWRPRMDPKGNQRWYNVITDQEVMARPESMRGGILADMMGLGKTLSILSLIAETKDEARLFASQFPSLEHANLERNAKGTLIICPKSVMSNWEEQIRSHVKPGKLKYYIYHGSNRTDDTEELAQYNIVLTTYNTAAAELAARDKALSAINWFRIVLDEAHQIRNQNTKVSKACCELVAQRRWAVTGTPVQNGLGDVGALIRFLRVKPFDDSRVWSQYIISPFRNANTDAVAHLRLLVDSITLRRTKDKIDLKGRFERIERLKFTDSDYRIYKNMAGDFGTQLRRLTSGSRGHLKGKAYAQVLKSIGRLRMFCAHGLDLLSEDDRKEILEGMNPDNAIAIDLGDEPGREEYNFVTEKQAYDFLSLSGDSDADRCEMCNRKIGQKKTDSEEEEGDITEDDEDVSSDTMGYLNPCYHLICPDCKPTFEAQVRTTMTADERHECPVCQTYVRYGLYELRRSALRKFMDAKANSVKKRREKRTWDDTNYSGPSAKVQSLIHDLRNSAAETANLPEGETPIRSVVFSSWTTYLDLIEIALEDNRIGFVRLDGTMSIKQRSAVLQEFANNSNITVILVSIRAGGQGLNLTAANKVYMMEPQFNPGVEQQAIDRVHRLGQQRDVYITHYIMNDSVEEGILKLQQRKEDLARFTLERKMSRVEEAKKRIEALRDLFR